MALQLSNAAASIAAGAGISLPAHVWRASELASFRTPTVSTGFPNLDNELPSGGWPSGSLIELLTQQPGIGEIRLLLPALRSLSPRKIILIQPPHTIQARAWQGQHFSADRLLSIRTKRSADAFWAAEQVLRSGAAGALLLWQPHVRPESLRRLHLAAQSSDVSFWFLRPLASTQDASPAPLRLALRPAKGAISVEIVKRRGPRRDTPLLVSLPVPAVRPTFPELDHASLDMRNASTVAARSTSTSLV
jgi:protein ImuA